ncbi:glycogen debranching enzyme GlgX [Lewinellaceae bacterium SD302]|nr:glycogen debranching enzyme GlgX [Lewinellaceae bacterium SD302]
MSITTTTNPTYQDITAQQEQQPFGNFGDISVWPGEPYPLGATLKPEGVNFALFSEEAERVDLSLFHCNDPDTEAFRIRLVEQTDHVWHCFIPDLGPGWRYGYRVHGPWAPKEGKKFNPNKLLIDPNCYAIDGPIEWEDAMFAYPLNDPDEDRYLKFDPTDSAPFSSKSVIIDPSYDWEGDSQLKIPMHRTVIYECHVKGLTMLHPEVPKSLRGTYAGLAHPATINYLRDLGVTAVELMPVHHFAQDSHLKDKGLRNYWGYNTLAFLAPHVDYAANNRAGDQVREFKDMVKTLHQAGIEVILDVVYNHTAEGNHYGPTLSMRGIDNQSYYRLVESEPEFYMDYTGTGNTLNMLHPRSLQLVMDSLRYWVTEMHVDGFRFDLASALARGLYEVGKLSTFLDTIHQDPVISQVKLIAEPWDVGPGGYQVGNFPVLWSEWNGKYRDNIRSYWRGDKVGVGDLAYRLSGSSDLYEYSGRKPSASINFVTAHDGFTLRDLVSYNEKHNTANGENNQDGDDHNLSWNCGVEGPTDDPEINALRGRMQRNFLTTLFLSQGVPMLTMGDEYGRTQNGNNNAYCQDNELSWFSWDWDEEQTKLHAFTRDLIKLRLENPIFHRRRFFTGESIRGEEVSDILWLNADGEEVTQEQWEDPNMHALGMLLNGEAMEEYDEYGSRIDARNFLILLNSYWEPVDFVLPGLEEMTRWEIIANTVSPERCDSAFYNGHEKFTLYSRSLAVFRMEDREGNLNTAEHPRVSLLDQMRKLWKG